MVLTSIVFWSDRGRASPSRVFKGVRLPGHMLGCDTITTKNLEVVRVDEDMNLILLMLPCPAAKWCSSHSYGLIHCEGVFRL